MVENIKLSKRLKTIATFVSKGACFADIGSDHGYLPCYICQNDNEARVIATEVSNGPFLRTKATVNYYQLSDQIEVRLGDGLKALHENDPVTEIVIAGMGGTRITNILEEGKYYLKKIDKLIIQPNNHAEKIRKFFLDHHYNLSDEIILEENKQIYEILVAHKNGTDNVYHDDIILEKQLLFGPILMKEKSEPFRKKWQSEKVKIEKILAQIKNKDANKDKIDSFQQKLSWIEEVLT